MDDEFKLCWKNFQDNIASGFQNLYDRGDLVDVTLACDGKLLHAHKIVLAICSPYFQEIFITNPCKHPIIILKDVTFNIMCELLEFMYQGVVNVKHTELQSFMKIGQLLQIKGLATNSSTNSSAAAAAHAAALEKSASNTLNNNNNKINDNNNTQKTKEIEENISSPKSSSNSEGNASSNNNSSSNNNNNNNNNNNHSNNNNNNNKETRPTTPTTPPTSSAMSYMPNIKNFAENNLTLSPTHPSAYHHHTGLTMKRLAEKDYSSDALALYARKQQRKSSSLSEQNEQQESGGSTIGEQSMEQMNAEEFFLSSLPHISMMDAKYDLCGVKRELSNSLNSSENNNNHGGGNNLPSTSRTSFPSGAYGFDFNLYKPNNSSASSVGAEYPNDLHMPNDYTKNFANHMDIPQIAPGERWFQGKLEFMLSQRGKPLLVHDGHTFGIQYVRKDKKYWQCNLSRKFNCKARVTTTDTGEIIVTNNEHCHTEIRQHLRKDYQRNKVMLNALINLSTMRQHSVSNSLKCLPNMLNCSPLHQQQEHHHHQQQQQQQAAQTETSNILDLAKGTSNLTTQDEENTMVHDLSTSTSNTDNLRHKQHQYQNDTESDTEHTSSETPGT